MNTSTPSNTTSATRAIQITAQQGFTLLELLIVVVIVAILAAIAVPNLTNYSQRAKYVEVVTATAPFKTAVELCALRENSLANCSAGNGGVPADATTSTTGVVASVKTGADGVITSTGGAAVDGVTYVITPALGGATNANGVSWKVSGTCQAKGWC